MHGKSRRDDQIADLESPKTHLLPFWESRLGAQDVNLDAVPPQRLYLILHQSYAYPYIAPDLGISVV